MTKDIQQLINKPTWTSDELAMLLMLRGSGQKALLARAEECLLAHRGDNVFYRGLVEFSNICTKDCLYCGIRKSNKNVERYELPHDQIVESARYAWEHNYGSLVLQSGERCNPAFAEKIDHLLRDIRQVTKGELGITLSLGEQSLETYRRWFNSGAHRYLLRIETTNRELYRQLHPRDDKHSFEKRLQCLKYLQNIGYQTGTGVMIGLPGQSAQHLADDLLFMKQFDIDMVGMGPYIEHEETPLYPRKEELWPIRERFLTALNMIALLRLMMPDINIAATTAMQTIDPVGREKALRAGANIIMPNITPSNFRKSYLLYNNKPCIEEGADDCSDCLSLRLSLAGRKLGSNQWGDSPHYYKRIKR